MRFLTFSNVVSILALFVASATLVLELTKYGETSVPPEVFVRLERFEASAPNNNENALLFSGEIEVAVSNRRPLPLYIVSCAIAGDGIHMGGGGFGEQLFECREFSDTFKENDQVVVDPGQTLFFRLSFNELVDEHNIGSVLTTRGFNPDLVSRIKNSDHPCAAHFSLSPSGGSLGVSCDVISRNQTIYSILLQTGDGDLVRRSVKATAIPDWPWGRLENYITEGHFETWFGRSSSQ